MVRLTDEERLQERKEGREEKSLEIAKKMLMNNLSITMISECTGLSKEEIEEIK